MSQMNRRVLIAGSLGAGFALPAFAQVPEGCGEQPKTAPALQPPLLLTDWAWLGRYRDDNAKLLASGAKVDVVFLGDSITEGWARTDPEFFSKGIVGRGISAQTTPQLLVRMHADVIALKPRVVHIMAGTNDIAHNTGPMTAAGFAEQHHGDVRDRAGTQDPRRAGFGAAGVEVLVAPGGAAQSRGSRVERVDARLREVRLARSTPTTPPCLTDAQGNVKRNLRRTRCIPARMVMPRCGRSPGGDSVGHFPRR